MGCPNRRRLHDAADEVLRNWTAAGLQPRLVEVNPAIIARLHEEYRRATKALRALAAQAAQTPNR